MFALFTGISRFNGLAGTGRRTRSVPAPHPGAESRQTQFSGTDLDQLSIRLGRDPCSFRVLSVMIPGTILGAFPYSSDIQSFELGHFDRPSIDKSIDNFAVLAARSADLNESSGKPCLTPCDHQFWAAPDSEFGSRQCIAAAAPRFQSLRAFRLRSTLRPD